MAGGNTRQSYINTLIFTIVAGIVSIGLLLLTFFSTAVSSYTYVLVTIEIGLVFVIAFALYNIIRNEQKVKKIAATAHKNTLLANTCPDYYTVGYENGTGFQQCRNVFEGNMPNGRPFLMYYTPSDTYEPAGANGAKFPGNPPELVISMNNFEEKRVEDACKIVNGRQPDSDTNTSTPNNYSIPWTDMRFKCEGLSYT
jgi:hypothetical protein